MIRSAARALPALFLCAAFCSVSAENAASLLQRIREASFRMYDRPGPLKFREGPPAAELIAVDMRRDLGGPPITESFDAPAGVLRLTLFWKPTSERSAEGNIIVAIRETGTAPSPAYHVKAEPITRSSFEIGHMIVQSLELPLPARRFVGNGVLFIVQEINGERVTHFLRAIRVEPNVWQSKLPDSTVASMFGTGASRLRAAFRIGPDTSVTIPLTPETNWDDTIRIGIISGVDWEESLNNGETVARVRVGAGIALPIILGNDTLRIQDAPGPSASFVGTTAADARDGAYVGAILSQPISVSAGELIFEYAAASGYLDVVDVVILPASSTVP